MTIGKRIRGPLLFALFALLVVAQSCSDSDDSEASDDDNGGTTTSIESSSTNSEGVQRQPEGQASFFEIEEVVFGAAPLVVLRNITDVEVSSDRLQVCGGEECFALPDLVVPPEGALVVATGSGGEREGVIVQDATLGDIEPADGELAVYVTDPSDPERIISYLEWGSTPHSRAEDAIEKGLWLEGTFAPSGDDAVRIYKDPDSGLWLWDAS